MRTVLVSDNRCNHYLAITRHAPGLVRFVEKCIHAFEHPFGNAPDLSHR